MSFAVDNESSGCKLGKLSDLLHVRYGKDHKILDEGNIPVYGSGGIMRYANKALYSKESVLIPRKGTLSNIIYINQPFWSVDTMFYTEMKMPNIAKYIYFFLKSQDLGSMNVGSAVPSMTTDLLNNLEIAMPPSEVLKTFEQKMNPLFIKMLYLKTENNIIRKLKNAYLERFFS